MVSLEFLGDLPGIECIPDFNFYDKLMAMTLAPLGLFVVFGALFLVANPLLKKYEHPLSTSRGYALLDHTLYAATYITLETRLILVVKAS